MYSQRNVFGAPGPAAVCAASGTPPHITVMDPHRNTTTSIGFNQLLLNVMETPCAPSGQPRRTASRMPVTPKMLRPMCLVHFCGAGGSIVRGSHPRRSFYFCFEFV